MEFLRKFRRRLRHREPMSEQMKGLGFGLLLTVPWLAPKLLGAALFVSGNTDNRFFSLMRDFTSGKDYNDATTMLFIFGTVIALLSV